MQAVFCPPQQEKSNFIQVELQSLCTPYHKPRNQIQYCSVQISPVWSLYASMSIYYYHSLQGSRLKAKS
jgi:hypothetical protein